MFHLPFTLPLDFSVCICVTAGKPFRPHYWLAQCSVYLVVMLVMKLIVGPLVAFKFWKEVGPPPLPPSTHPHIHSLTLHIYYFPLPFLSTAGQVDEVILPTNEHLRIAIVMFIVPLVVNVSNSQLNCMPLAEPSLKTLIAVYCVEMDMCGCVRATTRYHTPVTLKYDSVVNETSLVTQDHRRSSQYNMCRSFQWLWKSHLVLFSLTPTIMHTSFNYC